MSTRTACDVQVPIWIVQQNTVYLYQRKQPAIPCHCPNRGYEAGVYLMFIAKHYGRLPAFTAFVQADWFDSFKGDGLRAPPFEAWTLRCPELAAAEIVRNGTIAPPAWLSYFPLAGRHNYWPPRFVTRQERARRMPTCGHGHACMWQSAVSVL